MGGKNLVHDCGVTRSIGYFLEPLILIGLFAKKPISVKLKGKLFFFFCLKIWCSGYACGFLFFGSMTQWLLLNEFEICIGAQVKFGVS